MPKLKKVLLFITFLLVLHMPSRAFASFSFFSDCIMSYDLGGFSTSNVIVAPNSVGCQNYCTQECQAFTTEVVDITLNTTCPAGKTSNPDPEKSINSDLYFMCIKNCQNFKSFTSYKRLIKNCVIFTSDLPTTVAGCPSSNNISPYYNTNISVKSGGSFSLSLGSFGTNTIYMCGQKGVNLNPIISGLDPTYWTNSTQTVPQNSNICFNATSDLVTSANFVNYGISTDSQTNNAKSAANLPSSVSTAVYDSFASNNDMWYRDQTVDFCGWHARNYLFTKTGIFVKDGDNLSITYSGDFGVGYNSKTASTQAKVWDDALNKPVALGTNYNINVLDANGQQVKCSTSQTPLSYSFSDEKHAFGFLNSLEIAVEPPLTSPIVPSTFPDNSQLPYYVISGEKLRIPLLADIGNIRSVGEVVARDSSINPKWFGLTSTTADNEPTAANAVQNKFNSTITQSWSGAYYATGSYKIIPFSQYTYPASGSAPSLVPPPLPFQACAANPQQPGCNDCTVLSAISGCKYTNLPRTTTYSYGGTVLGLSPTTQQELSVRHRGDTSSGVINYYDSLTPISNNPNECLSERYKNNYGGLNVQINWGGCPVSNGDRLQYYITPHLAPTNVVGDNAWTDVVGGLPQTISVPSGVAGNVYLRIKPLNAAETFALAPNLKYSPNDPRGTYNIVITNFSANTLNIAGPLKMAVLFFKNTLLGSDGDSNSSLPSTSLQKSKNNGVLQVLYLNMIEKTTLATSVQSLLVLYIAVSSIGFLMGVIQMNTKELVTRTIKFSFIVAMISPTSWQFFYNNFFEAIMNGGIELTGMLISPIIGAIEGLNLDNDPYNVFAIFDTPMSQMLSKSMWAKIYAILCSSLFGFVFILLLINCFITYFIVITKCAVIYISSILGIALMLFMAPIFMCFSLFKVTQEYFKNWWRYLLLYMIQPVVIMTSVSVLNVIIIIALYSVMSFTVCPDCFIAIDLIVETLCLVPTYKIFSSSGSPGFFSVPINLFGGILTLTVLTQAMSLFTSLIADQTLRLIVHPSGGPEGSDPGSMGQKAHGQISGGAQQAVKFAANKMENRQTLTFRRNKNGGG